MTTTGSPTGTARRIVRAAAAEIVSQGRPKILCDLSTSGPQLAQELHDALSPRGIAVFDAPVSGGIRGAEQGTLAIMGGGPEAAWPRLGRPLLVGSSLGGYYATVLAERHGLSALLINPAVRPWQVLEPLLGEQRNHHHGATWQLTGEHLAALQAMQVPPPVDASRYQVWLQTGDETLDYRQAEAFYRHCPLRIEAGGDHGFRGFVRRLPALLGFAGLPPERWQGLDPSQFER